MKSLTVAILIWTVIQGSRPTSAQEAPDVVRAIRSATQKAVAVVSVGAPQLTKPHKAIYQYGLATLVVGLAPDGSAVGYRLVLLAVVPAEIPEADEVRARRSIARIVEPIATKLRTNLDFQPSLEDAAATAVKDDEDRRKHFEDYSAQVDARTNEDFVSASNQFTRSFGASFPKYASTSFLALGLRACAEPTCAMNDFLHKPRNRSTDRFGKLYGWMKSKQITGINQAYILNPQGTYWSMTAKLDAGYEWHADFPQSLLQTVVVNAAKHARRTKVPLPYSVAEFAALPREAAAHIADVFDSAYAAAVRLPSNPQITLPGISDELGRARLTECVRLRGAFDSGEAGKCAGYSLTPDVIAKCLAGAECAPAFAREVNLDSLTLGTNTSLLYFAQNAACPE